jgi:hypothetical protein
MSQLKKPLEVPVVFIVYKRPDQTRKVLDSIRLARPRRLYIVADGAKSSSADEQGAVDAVRQMLDGVDWDCQVFTDYSEKNLGVRERAVSGLNWVFSLEERAIILEDDCLASPSFFRFCEELLDRYSEEQTVAGIGGTNAFLTVSEDYAESYSFSQYPAVWGWATWSRVWGKYSASPPPLSSHDLNRFSGFAPTSKSRKYWAARFEDVRKFRLDTWDYQLAYLCMSERALWAIPNQNLVSNIGFGAEASHTVATNSRFARLSAENMRFPLKHPASIEASSGYDSAVRSELHKGGKLKTTLFLFFKRSPRWIQKGLELLEKVRGRGK